MTRLEQVNKWGRHSVTQYGVARTFIERDEAIDAARLDAEDAYRRGVEDARCFHDLEYYDAVLNGAKMYARLHNPQSALLQMEEFVCGLDETFHGARGIARVEIRQRLERLKKGNENV